ncbi:zinc finger BED domain-containing protein RICESLEEPER 2-like [Papaver somniferum]|uniref:zinc finger BED domain-containing protein RICESLEEPER 2-like n=1 Tax=Papaver somniferum TaxID=3469 RepID=UPI000E705546|nr:zinc finger BED domain-containing protein RICESLEEPER 2-like [Papaver somniferum]
MFCEVSGHKGIDIGEMLEKCLSDWGLKDVFSVTLDNVSANKVAIDYLTTNIVSMKRAEERAKYLHVRCAAHVLALVVKDVIRVYNKSIARIRSVVKYIKGSPSRLAKLRHCENLVGIESKISLILDVKTRWNNTFLMLEAALVFERAFTRLERYDKEYQKLFYFPTKDNEKYFDIDVNVFFDATVAFSASTKVTTHTFLWQLVIIYEQLVEFRDNVDEDPFIATMAAKMYKKYNKYWGDYAKMNSITFFAMLLDPREKEKGLEFALDCLYGKKSPKVELVMRSVLLDFKILFEEYKDVYSVHEEESSTSMQGQAKSVVSKPGEGPSRMKELMSRSKRFKSNPDDDVGKTELDRYLIDKFEEGEGEDGDDDEFDLLGWWNTNSNKYKILGHMAKDILAIHVSSVASESAFSTGKRVLSPYDDVEVEEELLGPIKNNATTSATME